MKIVSFNKFIMQTCKHFEECGGCQLRDVPYSEQVRRKKEKVSELADEYGVGVFVRPVNSYNEMFYRGKMEFSFADQGGLVCGLYSKKFKRAVVDVQECLLFSPDAEPILNAVKEFVKKKGYPAYNKFRHKGFLRNLILRKAKFTRELMVGIVTTGETALDKEAFTACLTALKLETTLKSVYWVTNDSLSDAVVFEKKELIYGAPFIKEELGGLFFNIDIDSFFQVNSEGVKDFYAKIKTYAGLKETECVLDLFCGVGSIGLFLASGAKFVWGVEVQKEIVDAAWTNAKINGIDNVSFFVSDARKFLNTQGGFYKDVDVLVVNPPRCGFSNKLVRAILRLAPKRIVYSSCNPRTFFPNLKDLMADYQAEFIEPFDFFPHTPHVECLSFLKRL